MCRLALAAVSLAFLATACQPATTELTEEQKAAIAAEIDSLKNELWAAISSSDIDRALSFILDAPETAWMTDHTVLTSLSAIDGYFRPLFATIQRFNIELAHSRTVVLAPDVVCTIRSGTKVAVDTAGDTLPESLLAETIVWVKRDGEWKVLLGHLSG